MGQVLDFAQRFEGVDRVVRTVVRNKREDKDDNPGLGLRHDYHLDGMPSVSHFSSCKDQGR